MSFLAIYGLLCIMFINVLGIIFSPSLFFIINSLILLCLLNIKMQKCENPNVLRIISLFIFLGVCVIALPEFLFQFCMKISSLIGASFNTSDQEQLKFITKIFTYIMTIITTGFLIYYCYRFYNDLKKNVLLKSKKNYNKNMEKFLIQNGLGIFVNICCK